MSQNQSSKRPWQTYLTLILSSLGMAYFFIQAVSLGIAWLISLIGPQEMVLPEPTFGHFIWVSLFSGLLFLPMIILSKNKIKGKENPGWLDMKKPEIRRGVTWSILAWPIVVFLGWLVAGMRGNVSFLLGFINILVVGLPLLWIFNMAGWKLDGGPQLRQWRIFGFSLAVMPVLVIIWEVIAILFIAVFGMIFLTFIFSVNPQFEHELMSIVTQLNMAGQDMETIFQIIEPYLTQPSVFVWLVVVIGGIMPLIEEVIKPIALWPLAKKKISPQEGFVGGLLCGAGFALMENVLYFTTVINAEEWLFMALGRGGTGVLHMLASGLMGWGLAKTWREGKWGFQALMTFIAFLLHGLWNTIALFAGIAPIYLFGLESNFKQTLVFYIPMSVLFILSGVGIFWINRRFQKDKGRPSETSNQPIQEEINVDNS